MSSSKEKKLNADKKLNDYKLEIGQRIKEVRSKAGKNQVEFSGMVGCSQPKIYRIEQGERLPDVILLKKTSEIFGVTLEWLINGKEVKKQ